MHDGCIHIMYHQIMLYVLKGCNSHHSANIRPMYNLPHTYSLFFTVYKHRADLLHISLYLRKGTVCWRITWVADKQSASLSALGLKALIIRSLLCALHVLPPPIFKASSRLQFCVCPSVLSNVTSEILF